MFFAQVVRIPAQRRVMSAHGALFPGQYISLTPAASRATRFSCRRVCVSPFLAANVAVETRDLVDRAIRLIDSGVGVRKSFSVGIGDRDAPERLAADDAGLLLLRPIGIVQGIVFVGVAVRPAIYGDGLNIRGGIESAGRQHRSELLANISLESCEAGVEKFAAAGLLLLARGQTRFARHALQMQYARLSWIRGGF